MNLAEYAEKKKPETLQEKFAVLGAWFRHHRQLEEITVEHVFTCFHLLVVCVKQNADYRGRAGHA